jgi:hypothetical protein
LRHWSTWDDPRLVAEVFTRMNVLDALRVSNPK